jgi:hypothetical protein
MEELFAGALDVQQGINLHADFFDSMEKINE